MGKYGRWIAGGLGWAFLGPIGGVLGFMLGSAIDTVEIENGHVRGATRQGDFVMSLLILVAAVMKADGKVLKVELDYVKGYLVKSFGVGRAGEAITVLRDILKQNIPVEEVCQQIQHNLDYSSRLQLMHFLFGIAQADGIVSESELNVIDKISYYLGIQSGDYNSIKSMFIQSTESSYKILDLTRDASDAEVKKAYRKMAAKYHPDKVSYLGEDVQEAAKEKFQKLSEAFEKIKKERGFA
ncbi:DnaJ domain-containing protein [Labilibaculum sp. A4]|uniref:TerB family tellurite resistance protein n=1 Tax=Labilibaculum euxinus TaxID=2686357 RepID=UPI000F619EF3|nr:TerB family tellurite resistance protein [Labilibaculum euxinus]MDQ1771851.1 TerB family tellurite resistance protein [Labilibaculum euxinus]MWN77755.1 DnaJ domain-containing protein [Labilibaculum euxinus]